MNDMPLLSAYMRARQIMRSWHRPITLLDMHAERLDYVLACSDESVPVRICRSCVDEGYYEEFDYMLHPDSPLKAHVPDGECHYCGTELEG